MVDYLSQNNIFQMCVENISTQVNAGEMYISVVNVCVGGELYMIELYVLKVLHTCQLDLDNSS